MPERKPVKNVTPGLEASALLVVDVQRGLFKRSTPIFKADRLLTNINTLVDRAHRAGVPVIYVQHSNDKLLPKGNEDWQLHPALDPLPGDITISKCHGSAFEETPLAAELAAHNIKMLVITGLVTHGCVKATCLDAYRLGYQVVLVGDGHSNYSKQAARLIDDWNKRLGRGIVKVRETREIQWKGMRRARAATAASRV